MGSTRDVPFAELTVTARPRIEGTSPIAAVDKDPALVATRGNVMDRAEEVGTKCPSCPEAFSDHSLFRGISAEELKPSQKLLGMEDRATVDGVGLWEDDHRKFSPPRGYSTRVRWIHACDAIIFGQLQQHMKAFTGYVATLDVLGFAELLYREGYSQKLSTYLETINEVIRPVHVKVECVIFSDSIVLTSSGDTDDSFNGLITACSATFYELVMCEMPVRGAIAYGRYWRETAGDSVFLAGRPIVEAYRAERSQNWVGIILCSSVLHQRDGLARATDVSPTVDPDEEDYGVALRLQPASVPFQDGAGPAGELSAYAIVPLRADDSPRRADRSIRRVSKKLHDLRLKAPEPRAQSKYGATLKWLQEVEGRLEELSQSFAPSAKRAPSR
jgi:hypothetical protein